MKKAELIELVAWQAGVPRYIAARVLRDFVHILQKTLRKRGRITLWGLGTFRIKDRDSKTVVYFDGREEDIEQGPKVCFKPAPSLKRAARNLPK